MNYVKHLNVWFELMKTNPEMKPTHIALYVVLFQYWNQNHFAANFVINRHELMNAMKLGSNSTYSKCMKDLHQWGWIIYYPSRSKYGVSLVSIIPYEQLVLEHPSASTPMSLDTPKKKTTSNVSSSESSNVSSTRTSSEQEAGHLLKQENKEEKTTNSDTPLKNKFYEPL